MYGQCTMANTIVLLHDSIIMSFNPHAVLSADLLLSYEYLILYAILYIAPTSS